MKIAIAGCGALGSWIGLFLSSYPDLEFVLIDDDRVEEQNLLTSAYSRRHLGQFKAVALAEMIYRKSKVISVPRVVTLDKKTTPRIISGTDLIVDVLDNPASRNLLSNLWIEVVHIGVNEVGIGAVTWDKNWRELDVTFERGHNPVCTNQLGFRILLNTAIAATNAIIDYLDRGEKNSLIVTDKMEVIR